MKFKPHFVLLFMIAACAIFATATVGKASASMTVAFYDHDVGWQSLNDNEQVIPELNQCSQVLLPEMPQEVPSAPEPGWLSHESPESNLVYWPARDSKASRCKTSGLFINTLVCSFLVFDLRNDGNEARRLSIKAKA